MIKMKRPKSAKIYIKLKDQICNFMWANLGPDNTVMMGFLGSGTEGIDFILDKNLGQLAADDINVVGESGYPKITFHPSGHYKLATHVGLRSQARDRCTVVGPPLSDITQPRRMVEILIPKRLSLAQNKLLDRDIVLDASDFPHRPLRCTISCMSPQTFDQLNRSGVLWVNTSECEFTEALGSDSNIWIWTLRVSREDKKAPDKFHYFIHGEIKWGKDKGGLEGDVLK